MAWEFIMPSITNRINEFNTAPQRCSRVAHMTNSIPWPDNIAVLLERFVRPTTSNRSSDERSIRARMFVS